MVGLIMFNAFLSTENQPLLLISDMFSCLIPYVFLRKTLLFVAEWS